MSSQYRNISQRTRLWFDEALDVFRRGFASDESRMMRSVRLQALEQRILMSASPMAVVIAASEPAMTAETTAATQADEPFEASPSEAAQQLASDSVGQAQTDSTTATAIELIVVDQAVHNAEQLVADLQSHSSRSFHVLLLNSQQDGISQITQALQELNQVSAIHMVSHAEDGEVLLGTGVLSQRNIERYSEEISTWQNSLTADADLLFYGCDLSASESGRELLHSLNALTRADVAASQDATGHSSFGGNWELEFTIGDIQTSIAFSEDIQSNWAGKLAVINVTTTQDIIDANDGVISLREAVLAASAGDTIQLAAGTYTLTLTGSDENGGFTGDLDIVTQLTIRGAQAATTIIDGNGSDRIFEVIGNGSLTLSDVTIQGGGVSGNNSSGRGGGIAVSQTQGELFLNRVVLQTNTASNGGAIFNAGTIQLTDVMIVNNGNPSTDEGGGLLNDGTAVLTNVTISGNQAESGGGIYQDNGASLTLTNVTLSGNTADESGGAIYARSQVTIVNSTITQNSTSSGSILQTQGGQASIQLQNTIVAGNNGSSQDLQGRFQSLGNNLIGNGNGQSAFTNGVLGDQVGTAANPLDPGLAPLQNNGGFVTTHALLPASTAIAAGQAAGAPPTDARGLSTAGRIDIGAFQSNGVTLNRLYWADEAAGKIQSANIDGSDLRTVASGLNSPDEVFVDSVNGKVYWSETESRTISRANLNGTDIEVILTGLIAPNGLAVDTVNQKIYWIEDGGLSNLVRRSDLDGTNQETIINIGAKYALFLGFSNPHDLVLDVHNGKLYWTDDLNVIERANLDGSDRETIVNTAQNPEGLTIDPYHEKLYWTNYSSSGSNDAVYQASLDGSGATTIVSTGLEHPDGITVDAANRRLYWTDRQLQQLLSSAIDGSDVQVLPVTGLSLPKGIALGVAPPPNQPPVAHAGGPYAISEQESLVLDAGSTTDPENEQITFEWDLNYDGVTFSAELTGQSPTADWSVLTAAGISGGNTWQVAMRATDGNGASSIATTTVQVNALPVITNIADIAFDEDTASPPLAFDVSDVETASSSLVVTATSDNQAIVADSGIVISGDATNRSMTLNPVVNAFGTANITITVSDGIVSTATTFQVTVNAVNDAPVVSPLADQTTLEDTATDPITFTIGDVDNPVDALVITATSDDQSLIGDADIVVSGTGASRSITLTPQPDANGTATITVGVSDGAATTFTTFRVAVTPVNDAPVISTIADVTTLEDTATGPLAFTVGDVDNPVDALVITATSDNQSLISNADIVVSGTGASRSITLTPRPDANGTATITVGISDGAATTFTTFRVTVTPVNDAPVISTIADVTTLEDTATGPLAFTVGDVDNPVDALVITATSDNQSLISNADIVVSGTGDSRSITLAPQQDANGTATITVGIFDGTATIFTTFRVTVTPVNDAPVFPTTVVHRYVLTDTNILSIASPGLLSWATDVDGDQLAAQLITTSLNSTVTLNPDGSFQYVANTGFSGTDSFVFLATDGLLNTSPQTVTLQVPVLVPSFGTAGGGGSSSSSQLTPSTMTSTSPSTSSSTSNSTSSSTSSSAPDNPNTAASSTTVSAPTGEISASNGTSTASATAPPIGATQAANGNAIDRNMVPPPTAAAERADNQTASTMEIRIELEDASALMSSNQTSTSDSTFNRSRTSSFKSFSQSSSVLNALHEFELTPIEIPRIIQPGYQNFAELKGTASQVDEFQKTLQSEYRITDITASSVAVAGTSIVIGSVVTALRTGMLALGFLSQLPVWTLFDPLMVMDGVGGDDGDSLQDIVDQQDQPSAENTDKHRRT